MVLVVGLGYSILTWLTEMEMKELEMGPEMLGSLGVDNHATSAQLLSLNKGLDLKHDPVKVLNE